MYSVKFLCLFIICSISETRTNEKHTQKKKRKKKNIIFIFLFTKDCFVQGRHTVQRQFPSFEQHHPPLWNADLLSVTVRKTCLTDISGGAVHTPLRAASAAVRRTLPEEQSLLSLCALPRLEWSLHSKVRREGLSFVSGLASPGSTVGTAGSWWFAALEVAVDPVPLPFDSWLHPLAREVLFWSMKWKWVSCFVLGIIRV